MKYNYLMTEIGLEIGSRDTSFFDLVRKDLLPKGGRFVFIDKRYRWLTNLRNLSDGRKEGVTSLGQKLPFKKDSIPVIFVKDLFGAHGYSALESSGAYTIEDIGGGFAQEWFRVCRHGGKVIIMEISIPPDEKNLKNEFLNQGFILREELKGEEALNILEEGKSLKIPLSKNSFSLIFEKIR